MKLTKANIEQIAESVQVQPGAIKKHYLIAKKGGGGVVIFQTTYNHTPHAKPSEDGKLRELNTEYFWMTVTRQNILPKPGLWEKPPLPYNIIYT
jgi:hypothetical protein